MVKKWDKYKPDLKPKERDSFNSRELDLRKNIIKASENHKKVLILFNELNNFWWILWVGFFLGIIQSGLGFVLWYVQIQKPNDELLKKQIKDYKKQESTTSGEEKVNGTGNC